jgi:hypothetical protein
MPPTLWHRTWAADARDATGKFIDSAAAAAAAAAVNHNHTNTTAAPARPSAWWKSALRTVAAAGVAALQAGTPTGGAVQNLQPRDFTATPEYGQLCPATLAVDDSMHGKQACCMLDKALGAMEVFNDARKCSGKYTCNHCWMLQVY